MITLPNIDPSMIANNLTPFEPTHPGELIRDELEERHLTQAKLAEQIGVSPSLTLWQPCQEFQIIICRK